MASWKEGVKFHSQYDAYVKHYIPEAKRPLLNEPLTEDSPDLQEIAKYPTGWQTKLVGHLELANWEVKNIIENAIKKNPNNPALQERLANS